MGKTVLTTAKMNVTAISKTDGHTQPFVSDNLTVARRTTTNIRPARTNRRTTP